jgi:hypothetical protein
MTMGVPVILPLVVEKAKPGGRAGTMDQATTAPPEWVGTTVLMAVPFVKVREAGL